MTTKTLSTYVAAGYTLSSSYSELDITATGGVGGTGVYSNHYATISNAGRINATSGLEAGVDLPGGGLVINRQAGFIGGKDGVFGAGVEVENFGTIRGTNEAIYDPGGSVVNGSYTYLSATIAGGHIVMASAAGVVSNFGTISASVDLYIGGSVTNGGVGDVTALINGGGGVLVHGGAGIANFGTIQAYGRLGFTGARAENDVTNGAASDTAALIEGGSGVAMQNYGALTNFGTIRGVAAAHGAEGAYIVAGLLTNGTAIDRSALIEGYTGILVEFGNTTLANWGTVAGVGISGESGVSLAAGGTVSNGGAGDTAALIEGASGVVAYGAATLANYGAIVGATAYGIQFAAGGALNNGTAIDHGALIQGYTGVSVENAVATVTNWGSIEAVGITSGGRGVYLGAGGQVTNGGAGDTAALISGASGVVAYAALTIANFGRIDGATGFGVEMTVGLITNGGAGAHSAVIEGYRGVVATGAATIKNFGTVRATSFSNGAYVDGVALLAGGGVVNGSRHNSDALISGYTGLRMGGPGTVTNFGTIFGTGENIGYGAAIYGGVDLTNGDAGHGTALIEGYYGLTAYGLGNTVTNFGTISGASGTALRFNGAFDVLVVEAGCAFGGAVMGGGGTLDLESGAGKLSGLGAGNVTVSGSMAPTTFQAFNTLEIGAGASFATSGAVSLQLGQSLIVAGALTLGSSKAAVANAGTIEVAGGAIIVNGAVSGNGSAAIDGGTLNCAASFNQDVAFGGTGVLELAQSQAYAASVSGFSRSGKTSLDLTDIAFTGAGEATYAGNKKGGVLTVTDGTHTARIHLLGNYLSAVFVASSDGHGGTEVVDPRAGAVAAPALRFLEAAAGWGAAAGWREPLALGLGPQRLATLASPRIQTA